MTKATDLELLARFDGPLAAIEYVCTCPPNAPECYCAGRTMAENTEYAVRSRARDYVEDALPAIKDETFDLALDAVGSCDRYDEGLGEMVRSTDGGYVRVWDAQAAIRKLQR